MITGFKLMLAAQNCVFTISAVSKHQLDERSFAPPYVSFGWSNVI